MNEIVTFFINVSLAFLIGFFAAFAELLSRYSDPRKIFSTGPSWVYLFINAGTASLVYYLMVQFEWLEGDNGEMANETIRVLVAGTSAMAILRSSFASIQVGGKQVETGLASILQIFLNWADRAFDQKRSSSNLSEVRRIMEGVNFEKAMTALPTTCFNSMKNVTLDEQSSVAADLTKLNDSGDLDNTTKSLNLGSILSDVTGLQLLDKAVTTLADSIKVVETREVDLKAKMVSMFEGQNLGGSANQGTAPSLAENEPAPVDPAGPGNPGTTTGAGNTGANELTDER